MFVLKTVLIDNSLLSLFAFFSMILTVSVVAHNIYYV
ncbi:unnamed protein product [Brugia timori]|uniref:Dolichyl-diphosphooligosaccharide--protein glycosyltransferase subunit 4 n=1 Tax=Brugia timori TaxID=42155 RepID=A0A0R3R1A2_9BILA|nr:unnamed protein product [Brugia timori]